MAEKDSSKAKSRPEKPSDEPPKKLRFHYIKSNAFRSIHADGVFGGVTPRLGISATFYNERHPLPDQTVNLVKEDGTLGEEVKDERIARDGLVRELEANVIMDVAFAKNLVKWLNQKIQDIEERVEELQKQEQNQEVESDALIT